MKSKKAIIVQPMGMYDFLYLKLIPIIRKKENCIVILLVLSEQQQAKYESILSKNDEIINLGSILNKQKLKRKEIIKESLRYEKKYSFIYKRDIIMQDRNYSTKYLSYSPFYVRDKSTLNNIFEIYSIVNNAYSYSEKLIKKFEILFAFLRPDSLYNVPITNVLEKNNILVSVPVSSRFKSYATWTFGAYRKGEFIESKFEKIRYLDKDISSLTTDQARYSSKRLSKSMDFDSYKVFFIDLIYEIIDRLIFIYRDLKNFRLPNRRAFYKWFFKRLNSLLIARWLIKNRYYINKKNSLNKYAIFFLGVQPEITSHSISREFWDEKTIIQQLALSLPSNYQLLLKEHPSGIGNKKVQYYRDLNKLPNVQILSFKENSYNLIKNSSFVVTIGGTVGIEAALLGKPVLVFSKRNWYNFLSNVYIANNISDLSLILNKLFSDFKTKKDSEIVVETRRLFQAIKENSFTAEDTPIFRGTSTKIREKSLVKAVKILYEMKKFKVKTNKE